MDMRKTWISHLARPKRPSYNRVFVGNYSLGYKGHNPSSWSWIKAIVVTQHLLASAFKVPTCTSTILCSMLEFFSPLQSLPVLGFKKNLLLSLASLSQPPGFRGYICEFLSISSSVSTSNY